MMQAFRRRGQTVELAESKWILEQVKIDVAVKVVNQVRPVAPFVRLKL